VTDLLRGCVILNDDVAEIRAAYAHMEDLKSRGVIDIVQNKNRYIDGPTITGYLDGAHCFIQTSNISEPLIRTLGPRNPDCPVQGTC
jgi:hypothetical protein